MADAGNCLILQVYEHDSRDAIINSGVNSFPTFHFYCNGGKVDECRGANIQNVEQRVQQHKGSARCVSSPGGGEEPFILRFVF